MILGTGIDIIEVSRIRASYEKFGERAGVQFDELAAGARGGFDLRRVGRGEQADGDPGAVQFFARLRERAQLANDVQSAFGGYFLSSLRDKANDVRLELQGDAKDFRRVGHFEVEPGFDGLAQFPNIAVLDVPAVFPQMGGDAVRAGRFANQRGFDRVRFAVDAPAITRFAERGDMVDVDTQFEHSARS